MDPSCLTHCLSNEERDAFERDGYLLVPDALSPAVVDKLTGLVDALGDERANEIEEDGRLHLRDFLRTDHAFMDLLDWPTTFPKVWGILGWHIQLYISHIDITPPLPGVPGEPARLGWHQDSGRLNLELGSHPRPRISLKVGYFLSDTTAPGCGNFCVIPGSHLLNSLEFPEDGVSDPIGAIPLFIPPGTAVFFDRRLWHSRSPNHSAMKRKAIFYGYSYRWLRPRDNLKIEDFDHCEDAIRRQLLGASHDGHGYSSPQPEDVPLKYWIREHLGEDAVVP